MKNRFTFSAIAALALASFGAQAQFTLDGTLAPAEVGTGVGKYQLLGTYTNAHSVTDRGLKALYVGTTATTFNVMVVASPEQTAYSALVLYLDVPNRTGVVAGTLLGSSGTTSPLRHRPTLDMPVDYGFRATVSPFNNATNAVFLSRVSYTVAPTATRYPESGLGSGRKDGTTIVFTGANDPFSATRTAFATSATGSVAANTTTGWEFEIPLTALGGLATNDLVRLFTAYVADNGDFYSDVLPQIAGQTAALGTDPDFSLIPGAQFYTYQVGTGVLANRAVAADALGATAYPNPLTTASQLTYAVASHAQPVSAEVYNSLGQRVLDLLNGTQAAGSYSASLAPLQKLSTGSYLIKLQVGNQFTSYRVLVN